METEINALLEEQPKKPKVKKVRTVKQTYNRLLVGKWSLFVGKYFAILVPYLVFFSINFQEYFLVESGWKVGLGAGMAFAVLGIAMIRTAKKDAKKFMPLSGDNLIFILGWAIVMSILYFLSSILADIVSIMFYGLLGLIAGAGFERGYAELNRRALLYRDSMEKNEIQEKIKNEKKEEKKEAVE